jgi:thiamine biosynthesis lipoprotein
MKKILALLLSGISFTLLLSACANTNNQQYTQTKILMDTPIKLMAYGSNAEKAVEESFKRLDEIEKMSSTVISTSDVAKINNAAGKEYVKVHPEIIKMIETSIEYSKLSDGAWDITLGPIINLWGIGTENERIPSDSEIKSKLPLVGYEKISINKEENSVLLKEQGMSIELGGIAKGFAADEVLKIYKNYGIKNGLISLGTSSMYALGKKQSGNLWSIGIRHPRSEDSQNYLGIIKISDEALSTSGDYERYFEKDGKRYHHIIDPKTGYPTDNGVMSNTIIVSGEAEDSNMIADLLTTTAFVSGAEKAVKLADSLPNVALEITTGDNKIYTSSGFKDRITNLNKDFKLAAAAP